MTTVSTDLNVYRDRLRRAQAELARQGIDFLLIGPSSDLFYLTGFVAHLSERLNLLILPREGTPKLILPVLEAPNARDRGDLVEVHAWEETESPSELAGTLIGGAGGTVLAVGDQLWSVFLLRLQKAIPAAEWTSALDVMRALRMQKDAKEVELMAEVSRKPGRSSSRAVRSAA
jgi:Xaa-Pro dipeptidase